MTLSVEGPPRSLSIVPAPASSNSLNRRSLRALPLQFSTIWGLVFEPCPCRLSLCCVLWRCRHITPRQLLLLPAASSWDGYNEMVAPSRDIERRDPRLEAMSPERYYCGILVGSMTVDRGETNTPLSSFAGSGLPPLIWIYAQPLNIRSSDHGRGAILIDVARQTSRKPERSRRGTRYFYSWSYSRTAGELRFGRSYRPGIPAGSRRSQSTS